MINNNIIEKIIGKKITEHLTCDQLGLVNSTKPNTLSFLDDIKFLSEVEDNDNITALICTSELAKLLKNRNIKTIICEDPRYAYYSLFNYLGKINYKKFDSIIGSTSNIHCSAYISEKNVIIKGNVVIGPNVAILPDVEIGENTIIQAGAVIGSEGFEHKRTSKGILSVKHYGKVVIGHHVEIGSNNTIDKGLIRDTVIGCYTKTDNLVNIAHGVHIGKRCFLPPMVKVAGGVSVGDDVWIGQGANISNGINIGDNAFISIGSVVTKNVEPGQQVTGNFAIEHKKFIQHIKEIAK